MAPRRKGALAIDEVIETPKTMPLDARQLVRSKEEMLDPDSFPNGYNGMIVGERTEGKLYMLMDKDNPTVEASWKVIGPYEGSPSGPVAWDDVQNKPTFATVATSGDFNDLTNRPVVPPAYDDTAIRTELADKANTADLAPVATSGSYNDLEDKPTIPEAYDDTALAGRVTALENASPAAPAWDAITDKPTFATVATSGSYNDLSDQPTIPEAYDDTGLRNRVSVLENKTETQSDWNESDSASAAYIANKPTIPEAYDDTALVARVTAVETDKANSADLAAVATSGSYNDLSNKPTIPPAVVVDAAMSDASENPVQNKVVLAAITDAIDVVETAIVDRYTKGETDAKIAEAMIDVDNEHFHPVTALPDPADAKNNHEYVVVTYAQDGTTIESEVHYLFYGGVFHRRTTQVSLDGYATEAYVGQQLGTLATVASSGSYNDLSDKPTIPEAYDDTALAGRVTAIETALNLTALTDEEIAALVPA